MFPFLKLPRELRDMVYHHYVLEPDGYHFDYNANTFRKFSGQPLDLSLLYTCKAIREEMRYVTLNINRLVFATVYSESERLRAGRWQRLVERIQEMKCFVLASTVLVRSMRRFFTTKVEAKVKERYPQFLRVFSLIDSWNTHNLIREQPRYKLSSRGWGGSYSTFSSFVTYTLGVIAEESPDFIDAATSMPKGEWVDHRKFVKSCFLLSDCSPWSIPSEQEIKEMEKVVPLKTKFYFQHNTSKCRIHHDTWERIKWRWSAAACAILFFKSLPGDVRLQIRRVSLVEDHESVGHPECHAVGLIPFCLENPMLHFEHRLSLWSTVLPSGMAYQTTVEGYWGSLSPSEVSHCFKPWLSEAVVLDGMPAASYSMVIDGDPLRELSSEIFEEVKHDVAWQLAAERYLEQRHVGLVPLHWWRQYAGYLSEAMPRAVEDVVKGTSSFIRCNFETGDAWPVEDMLNRFANLTEDDVWFSWIRFANPRPDGYYETEPPLPTWYDFRLSQILPRAPDPRRKSRRREPLRLPISYDPYS